jgi:hypothetical protein
LVVGYERKVTAEIQQNDQANDHIKKSVDTLKSQIVETKELSQIIQQKLKVNAKG